MRMMLEILLLILTCIRVNVIHMFTCIRLNVIHMFVCGYLNMLKQGFVQLDACSLD
jgi:hypothetical protein